MDKETRIQLGDTVATIIESLAEGNIGALRVCIELFGQARDIDPDNVLGGFGPLLHLDYLNIYGPRIWMLYKDVCHKRIVNTVTVLRASQLGFLSPDVLDYAIDNRGVGLSILDTFAQVQERLPRFADREKDGKD